MGKILLFLLVLRACDVICSENQTVFNPDLRHHHNNKHQYQPVSRYDPNESSESSQEKQSVSCSRPSSCAEILTTGQKRSGVYTIYPRQWMNTKEFQVYCDMETAGGGWTVIQRRRDNWNYPEVNFKQKWDEYKKGFGDLRNEFWLGNDRIHVLTSQDRVALRIEMEDWDGELRYAMYNTFGVENAAQSYKATILDYSGTAGDLLQNGFTFSTYNYGNCATITTGGWWYYYYGQWNCDKGSLNGIFYRTNITNRPDGIVYNTFRGRNYTLKTSEMKLRPAYFPTYAPFVKK